MNTNHHHKGFTLVEIIIVTSIISILAAFSYSSLQETRAISRFSQVELTFDQTAKAAELFRFQKGYWPADARPGSSVPAFVSNYFPGTDLPNAPCPGYVYDWQNWPDYNDWGDNNLLHGEKIIKLSLLDNSLPERVVVASKCIYIEPNWQCNESKPGAGNTLPDTETSLYCCNDAAECTSKQSSAFPPSQCADISTVTDRRLFCN